MKKIWKPLVILCNIVAFVIIYYFNTYNQASLVFTKDQPIQIQKDTNLILIRGEVAKEGRYILHKSENLAKLIELAGGFTKEADIEKFTLTTSKLDLNSTYSIFVPSKNSRKIFINFARKEEIQSFFDISEDTAKKLLSNKPFLSLKDFELCMKNLNIPNTKEVVI